MPKELSVIEKLYERLEQTTWDLHSATCKRDLAKIKILRLHMHSIMVEIDKVLVDNKGKK